MNILLKFLSKIKLKSNKIIYVISLFFLVNSGMVYSQETKLFFKSSIKDNVIIYMPIDGKNNNITTSHEIKLLPNEEVCFKPKITDFCFIQIKFSTYRRVSILIHNGDSLHINYNEKDKTINFNGNNAYGQQYLTNFSRILDMDSIFNCHTASNIDANAIRKDMKSLFFDYLNSDLEELKTKKNVNPEFCKKVYNDMNYAAADMLTTKCLFYLSKNKKSLTKNNQSIIDNLLDSIYTSMPPNDINILKYRYSGSYISMYYNRKFEKLSENKKKELLGKYSKDTFGPHLPFLMAPKHIQKPKFGFALLIQLQLNINEFDPNKMYKFLKQNYPESEYLKYIEENFKEFANNSKNKIHSNEIYYINKEINSLDELLSLPELKGKKIFIDIWATWCIPCKMEFQYNKKLHLLTEDKNVTMVYISIDKKEALKRWKKEVEYYKLTGFNILANDNLINDIKEKIYMSGSLSIPRFVYVNKKGEIVNSNVTRPSSNLKGLEEMFSE